MNYKQLFFIVGMSLTVSLFPKIDPDQTGYQFTQDKNKNARIIFVNDTKKPLAVSYKSMSNLYMRKGAKIEPHGQWIMTNLGKWDIWENPSIAIQLGNQLAEFPLYQAVDNFLPLFTSEAFGRTLEDIEKDHVVRLVIVVEKNEENKPLLIWYYKHPSGEFVPGGQIPFMNREEL